MKIALLGTGFSQAHAAVYALRGDVDEVIVFGRTPEKLTKLGDEFGFVTSTDLDAVISDDSVDLVDICLPTRLHADTAVRAMRGRQGRSHRAAHGGQHRRCAADRCCAGGDGPAGIRGRMPRPYQRSSRLSPTRTRR